jgi:glutathione S-transferase
LEKGLQWETSWLDLSSGEHKKPEYLAINPVGKVPALIDDGVIVHDSTIINEYLEDKFPQNNLFRRIPLHERERGSFEDYADAYLMPSLFKIFWELRKPEKSAIALKSGKVSARRNNITPILSASLMVATILLTNSALAISRSYRRWRISNAPAIRSRTAPELEGVVGADEGTAKL